MQASITLKFKVTPSQKGTIDSRATENGFDDTASYIKVAALKVQEFKFTTAGSSNEEPSVELSFNVTPAQKTKIEENIKESGCEDLTNYLRYVAMHGVVTAIVEVRSTGNLDAMLKRITDGRLRSNPKKLF